MRMERDLGGFLMCLVVGNIIIPAAAAAGSSFPFLNTLPSQCPLSPHPVSLLHVNGDFLDRALASERTMNGYTAVLLYAYWCPFSRAALGNFEALSSMYPHIEHLAIEQSSAMPSLFSRYGIHSLPAILIVNQESRNWYHGSTDLDSLVEFYKKTTGGEPVQYIALDQSERLVPRQDSIMQLRIGSSIDEILAREPYLIFSALFILLRVLLYIIPRILRHLRPILASYKPRINMEMFGGTSQTLGRILHIIDLKRMWTKLRLCKTQNFHWSTRNAGMWASSFASVSLGKTSASRWSS